MRPLFKAGADRGTIHSWSAWPGHTRCHACGTARAETRRAVTAYTCFFTSSIGSGCGKDSSGVQQGVRSPSPASGRIGGANNVGADSQSVRGKPISSGDADDPAPARSREGWRHRVFLHRQIDVGPKHQRFSPEAHGAVRIELLRLAEGALRLAVIERIGEPEPLIEIRLRQLVRRCDPSDLDPPEANST
jgi:hypothetical protein